MHDEILSAVGLNIDLVGRSGEQVQGSEQRRQRDPAFREQVLIAYEYSCAVCRMDIRLDEKSLALDAAHIKWHAAAGRISCRTAWHCARCITECSTRADLLWTAI